MQKRPVNRPNRSAKKAGHASEKQALSILACYPSGDSNKNWPMACAISDNARPRNWTQEELSFLSDVIAAGTIVDKRELEPPGAGQNLEASPTADLEITFLISQILKGTIPSDRHVVVHRCALSKISALDQAPNRYRLYLRKDGSGKFEPTSGEADTEFSIRPDLRDNEVLVPA